MKPTAFVTGMTGQDGPYLAKLLIEKGYHVYGLVKRYSNPNLDNIKWLGIMKGLDTKQWQMGHVVRLRTAGMEDITV